MSAIDNSATNTSITGTTTVDFPDLGLAPTAFPTEAITYNTSAGFGDSVDKEAFIEEWKKFRKDFLGRLLKDDPYPVKNFKMTRSMDPTTRKTTVKVEIEYEPEIQKSKIRTTL